MGIEGRAAVGLGPCWWSYTPCAPVGVDGESVDGRGAAGVQFVLGVQAGTRVEQILVRAGLCLRRQPPPDQA